MFTVQSSVWGRIIKQKVGGQVQPSVWGRIIRYSKCAYLVMAEASPVCIWDGWSQPSVSVGLLKSSQCGWDSAECVQDGWSRPSVCGMAEVCPVCVGWLKAAQCV